MCGVELHVGRARERALRRVPCVWPGRREQVCERRVLWVEQEEKGNEQLDVCGQAKETPLEWRGTDPSGDWRVLGESWESSGTGERSESAGTGHYLEAGAHASGQSSGHVVNATREPRVHVNATSEPSMAHATTLRHTGHVGPGLETSTQPSQVAQAGQASGQASEEALEASRQRRESDSAALEASGQPSVGGKPWQSGSAALEASGQPKAALEASGQPSAAARAALARAMSRLYSRLPPSLQSDLMLRCRAVLSALHPSPPGLVQLTCWLRTLWYVSFTRPSSPQVLATHPLAHLIVRLSLFSLALSFCRSVASSYSTVSLHPSVASSPFLTRLSLASCSSVASSSGWGAHSVHGPCVCV